MHQRHYTLKPVVTPVPNAQRPCDNERGPAQRAASESKTAPDACVRAENEDDDGYDPYSDRREGIPLFERDPWA